jgi:aminopeptidase-like protein
MINLSANAVAAGQAMHALARELWPINRSITGDGLRATLTRLLDVVPSLRISETPSGSRALDWTVPEEWRVQRAQLTGPDGEVIADLAVNNLHLMGYSCAVDRTLSLTELAPHLHSIEDQPDAIPYVTSYYQRQWGFCLPHAKRLTLKEGNYRALIEAQHFPGSLSYADLLLPGDSEQEVFVSSYCCHPSMANNELSGPVLAIYLAKWLSELPARRYSYRFALVPEMIGSLAYLQRHLATLKRNVVAGFNLSCVGDERAYSYLPSRAENTLADRIALHVLHHTDADFKRYRWLDRGSDESNYCAPGVDLPVASVMRSKYGEFPEYHTSLDDLDNVVTPLGLAQSYALMQRIVLGLEHNHTYRVTVLGEPQLGRRGLYPQTSKKGSTASVRTLLDLLSYADGKLDLLTIAQCCEVPIWQLAPLCERLLQEGLFERV